MGKSDEKQTKKIVHKATAGESKHLKPEADRGHNDAIKTRVGQLINDKKRPSFDTLGSNPFATTFEDKDGGFRHSQWCDSFRQLCEYRVQFGHCLVPQGYSPNPKLGQWVSNQRTRHGKKTEEKKTSMAAERIRTLDGIGFDWGTTKIGVASIWSVRFQQLCDFKAQFGNYFVPIKYSANPKLGAWVSKQRCNYRLY
jgi:hypothetical protein